MWCDADDRIADSDTFGNQKPETLTPPTHPPTTPLLPFAYSLHHIHVKLLFNPQRPHVRQTHTHTPLSPPTQELLPSGEEGTVSSFWETIISAHHTSISNLTRNLTFWCQAGPASDDPQTHPHSPPSLTHTQCQRYLTIRLKSRLSRLESGNQVTAHYDQASFGFPWMKPIQTDVPCVNF